ncbi:hypothetical protein ABT352_15795 [Streptosporangium sp. NPDC000563]|uniref:hypothetical protein n=1 Tax=Streptosporangium sp. NPDC000563 TaxID=3154366 RepID=UPI003318C7A4
MPESPTHPVPHPEGLTVVKPLGFLALFSLLGSPGLPGSRRLPESFGFSRPFGLPEFTGPPGLFDLLRPLRLRTDVSPLDSGLVPGELGHQ